MAPIVLIDFEASCLPSDGQSYPIEVALARTDGQNRSWLIYPLPAWRHWDWSDEAEALHNISRDLLDRKGQSAELVLAEMADFAKGCRVYADADLDAYWLDVLAYGVARKPPFPVHYLGEYLLERGYGRSQVETALAQAKERAPREHLAREDAKRLALAVRLLESAGPELQRFSRS